MSARKPQGPRGQRPAIRKALIQLVGESGYLATDADQVAKRAGLTGAEFFSQFGDLEACFAAVWSEIDLELAGAMSTAFAAFSGWQSQLRAAMSAGLHYLTMDEARARLYVIEAAFVSETVRELQSAAISRLRLTIDLAREEPCSTSRAPRHISDAITGAIVQRVHHLIRVGCASDLSAELPTLMYLAVLPFRGTDAAEAELSQPLG